MHVRLIRNFHEIGPNLESIWLRTEEVFEVIRLLKIWKEMNHDKIDN